MSLEAKCDVCGNEPSIGVACVPGMPMSASFGKNCLEAGAIPYWAAVANTVCIGGFENAADWWQHVVELTLPVVGKSKEQFLEDVKKGIQEEQEYFDKLSQEEDEFRLNAD